jgi:hypothetical protein
MSRRISEMTTQDWEFVIWALDYVESTAQEMQDDETAEHAHTITQKLRTSTNTRPAAAERKGQTQAGAP